MRMIGLTAVCILPMMKSMINHGKEQVLKQLQLTVRNSPK